MLGRNSEYMCSVQDPELFNFKLHAIPLVEELKASDALIQCLSEVVESL